MAREEQALGRLVAADRGRACEVGLRAEARTARSGPRREERPWPPMGGSLPSAASDSRTWGHTLARTPPRSLGGDNTDVGAGDGRPGTPDGAPGGGRPASPACRQPATRRGWRRRPRQRRRSRGPARAWYQLLRYDLAQVAARDLPRPPYLRFVAPRPLAGVPVTPHVPCFGAFGPVMFPVHSSPSVIPASVCQPNGRA